MKENQDHTLPDEPAVISLEEYRRTHVLPDDKPPAPTDDGNPKTDEAFWAGRSLAMRRSARWAA